MKQRNIREARASFISDAPHTKPLEPNMKSLKIVDRLAVAAMFTASVAISAASLTPLAAHAEMQTPAYRDVLSAGKPARQALGEDVIRSIVPGMPASDVVAMIGLPHAKMRFEATKTTAWDYSYRDAWSYDSEFSVIVDDAGIVVGKISTRNGGQ
jgi:hypothetical protein